jgi:GNAT superfamily N-acetyltransferase
MPTLELPQAITLRAMRIEDVMRCGQIGFEAHRDVAARHNVPPEQPSIEFSTGLIKAKLGDPNATGIVAESAGEVVGSVFLNAFPPAPVVAIGPMTAHPEAPAGVGRRLMSHVLDLARERGCACVRLVQSPSHLESLGLYTKLGFAVREPLVLMNGKCPAIAAEPGAIVRAVSDRDVSACNAMCATVHGFAREFELRNAIRQDLAKLVEREGRVTGYAAGVGLRGHAVAASTAELIVLLGATPQMPGPGFFVPARNHELLRRLLEAGLRMLWPAALMTRGSYQEPAGAFVPSIAF